MKRSRIISLLLAAVLVAGLITAPSAQAKSIYFSGEYKAYDGTTIDLSEYSGPTPGEIKRKEVASFSINIPHVYNAYEGILVKTGTNKYRSKKKGLVFKVYKKKIVVKVTNKKRYDKALQGSYKLVRHFYS